MIRKLQNSVGKLFSNLEEQKYYVVNLKTKVINLMSLKELSRLRNKKQYMIIK
ncbi:MAG: hypothetical protein N4A49_17040 [Marinifilaceae bacterium]|jgi:hypothetical protein|nr:hypothetical protein [Marinifilaceae bacterium]